MWTGGSGGGAGGSTVGGGSSSSFVFLGEMDILLLDSRYWYLVARYKEQ